jgi:O-antigen/teichoic acid export membrane protein
MLKYLKALNSSLSNLFFAKDSRSKALGRNVILSTILQGLSILLSFSVLPVSLNFVKVEHYGVWLSISSILMWFGYFDLGLGTGLKNKIGEAIAKEDRALAKAYSSTAYAVILIIMGTLAVAFYLASDFINWIKIFNLNESYTTLIRQTISIVFYMFLARFVLQLVNMILDALQLLFVVKLANVATQLIILLSIIILTNYTQGSILLLGIVFSISPVLVYLVGSMVFFNKYSHLAPSLKHINFGFAKVLYGLGLKFFLIQVSMLILFQTSSILIINLLGAEEVVQYNVAYNLFAMITVGFTTIAAPFWSAYTNAWTQKDVPWIKKTNKQLVKLWLAIILIAFPVLLLSDWIYLIWLKKDLNIPFTLSLLLYIYNCIYSFAAIYNMFINGTGKIQLQSVSLLISSAVFVPLIFFLVKVLGWGLLAFPVALLIISNYSLVIAPLQYRALINGTATGIMNK